MKKFVLILSTYLISILVISCSDELSSVDAINTQEAGIETNIESVFEDIDGLLSNMIFIGDAGFSSRTEGLDDRFCQTTSVVLNNKVKSNLDTLLIDFGSTGCTDPKGNVRKGKIIMTFVGDRKLAHNTTFDNFYFNEKKIEGTKSMELTSLIPPTFLIKLEDGKVTWPDGTYATRQATHSRVMEVNVQQPSNSAFYIKKGGIASGVNRDSKQYSNEITKDLVFKRSCMEPPLKIFIPVEGTKTISVTNAEGVKKVINIDFGDGTCDNKILVTVDGKTREVTVGKD